MINSFPNIYEIYKEFFESKNIEKREIEAIYNKYFKGLKALNYEELVSFIKDQMRDDHSLTISTSDLINEQEVVREANEMINYGGITNPTMLYDKKGDYYYLVGIQNNEEFIIKPLNKATDKVMICDKDKCMLQTRTTDGLIEENIDFQNKSISTQYYSNESLDYVAQNVFLPCFYSVHSIDPNIVSKIGIMSTVNGDKEIIYKYEDGNLKSQEETPLTTKDSSLYEQFQTKLLEMNFNEMIGNKRTK